MVFLSTHFVAAPVEADLAPDAVLVAEVVGVIVVALRAEIFSPVSHLVSAAEAGLEAGNSGTMRRKSGRGEGIGRG